MIIKIEDARICYEELLKKVRKKKGGRLLIFVGFDIDSICSLRLLLVLLRVDSIKFEIIPVFNYENLEKKIEDYKKLSEDKNEIGSIIMLNCGGTLDLTNHWFTDNTYDILCLIIDSHRPISHNNIHSDRIVFIDDTKYNLDNVPKEEDLKEVKEADSDDYESDPQKNTYKNNNIIEEEEKIPEKNNKNKNGGKNKNKFDNSINQEDNDESNNYFLDEEQEYLYGEEEPNKDTNLIENKNNEDYNKENLLNLENKEAGDIKRKRIVRKKNHLEDIEESDNECSKIEDIDLSDKKEKKNVEIDEKILRKNIKRKKKLKIANYYAGKYYGYPSTFIIYNIINQINRDDNQSLWLLIVAITDHYLKYHFSEEDYDNLYGFCLKEVLRLKKNSSNHSHNHIEDLEDNRDASRLIKTLNKEVKTISQELDYKLFLYKHWNLFDSFIYSNYTVAALMTWKEEGKKEVQKILAYMGIPLEEAKQKYTYMKNEYKSVFKDKIIEISKRFDMKDIVFESFIYQFDQRTQLSACDFVYCLNAILEYPFNMNEINGESVCITSESIEELERKNPNEEIANGEFSNIFNQEGETGGLNENNKIEKSNNNQKNEKRLLKVDHFWTTYEFLGLKNSKLVNTALDLAIKFQISLVNNGTAVIDKRKITPSTNFRYAIINNDLSDDIKYFQNPLSLEKLSLFVMNLYHKSKINKMFEIKPFILALSHSSNNSYFVAGVISYDGSNDKNDFSMRFRLSARKLTAKLIYNNFNDCIVEISKNDFIGFLEDVCQN